MNIKLTVCFLLLFLAALPVFAEQNLPQNNISTMTAIYGDQGLRINLSFSHPLQASAEYAIKIYNAKNNAVLWEGKPENPIRSDNGKISVSVKNLQPELWQPSHPVLYMIELSVLENGRITSTRTIRSGFRIIESRNGRIWLNHKPIFLRGIAINPPGRDIPEKLEKSRQFAIDYVSFMKSINVNIIRIPDDETWYEVCDELGMMVFGGNYSGSVNGETPPANYDKAVNWYKDVKFLPIMHHPSLIIYALTNEVPFRGEIAKKWLGFLTYAHHELLKWDNTRLYIGNAGYGYGLSGDICDLHRYWGWYYSSPYTFLNIRDYDQITFPDRVQPLTFTECVGNFTGPDGRYNLTPNHKNPVSQQNWTGHAPQNEQARLADEHQMWVMKETTELLRRLRRINTESSGVFPFTILFRNWHTATDFIDMDPKPVTRQVRTSYQPVLLSWEYWQPQVYAGATINPVAHIINDADDFSDLKDIRLVVRLLDKANVTHWSDTIGIKDIPYFNIFSQKLAIRLPDCLFTGYYQLEGIVFSSGKEVSRNCEQLYIANRTTAIGKAMIVPVYDPAGTTAEALSKLGFQTEKINEIRQVSGSRLLVIGENAADKKLADSKKELDGLLNAGCRIIILRQDETHQPFVKNILPVNVGFPSMNIDDPTYPPPARPSRNSFCINPERTDHPVFAGISREELKIWSDYTKWDETRSGFPSIYPVTNGFIIENKEDMKNTAVLADYSVGLEGIALAEFFSGKGSVMLSGFDLINRAGLDPVADRLLTNMVEYDCRVEKHAKYPLIDAPVLWGEYETEKGVLTGIYSGLMVNSMPFLTGSYEALPISVDALGYTYAGRHGGWNNQAGKQYVPYGRRIFGPYTHRDFGGIPEPAAPNDTTGRAFFFCSVPTGTSRMVTTVWNPAKDPLTVTISVNGSATQPVTVMPNEYKNISNSIDPGRSDLRIDLQGDRRLVILETVFE
jgi:hypothetical protein